MRLGIISDIHMRDEYSEQITESLKTAKENIREFDPDAVAVLGDVIQGGNREEDIKNIEKVRETLDFSCDTYYLAGNHDSANLSNSELEYFFGNELYSVVDKSETSLLILNTSSPWLSGSRGEVTQEQLEFVKEQMQRNQNFTVLIHHPIHYQDLQDSFWWKNYPERAFCGNKKEINKALRPEKINCVINGHLHKNSKVKYNKTRHITINALSREKPEKPVTGTYAKCKIGDKNRFEIFERDKKIETYSF